MAKQTPTNNLPALRTRSGKIPVPGSIKKPSDLALPRRQSTKTKLEQRIIAAGRQTTSRPETQNTARPTLHQLVIDRRLGQCNLLL